MGGDGAVSEKAVEAARDPLDEDMMHPDAGVIVGNSDPHVIGQLYKRYFIELGGLRPEDRVLEVGCGVGRMAIPLTRYLRGNGTYEGFDIVKSWVKWCRSRISPRFPNFRFQHANVSNTLYRRRGRPAATFTFPYPDRSFDFVFLASVFTHMLPDGVSRYVAEIARVLKPGGRCFLSCFLLDEENLQLVRHGKPLIAFPNDHGNYRTMSDVQPEAAIAYSEPYLRNVLSSHGLTIAEPVHFADWSGRREPTVMGQDIIVAVRQEGTRAPAPPPARGLRRVLDRLRRRHR